ncbi:MAG: hypothetical protein EOO52_15775 [Gammaproteobacteria bacterium]|nr:MAG: hypothetical protein EOO52_15775 [Gammaproteobacteria bacterium]
MELDFDCVSAEYSELRRIGYSLAGGLNDLPQRAAVYYHLYEDSEGRNIFPLMAAHGALWAKGYFQKGIRAGKILSLQYVFSPKHLTQNYKSLIDFANAFRDINRRVCAEAYCVYHFTKKYGQTKFAEQIIPKTLLIALNRCHYSQRIGKPLNRIERKELFEAFFLWEQETIVSPSVEKAVENFNWSCVKWLAMKPKIEFAYFGDDVGLQFKNFSLKAERIEKGLDAYELAEKVGYKAVEDAICHYKIMPKSFFDSTSFYFLNVYKSVGFSR